MENEENVIIHELEDEFVGIGEVKGIIFKKKKKNEHAYIFELTDSGDNVYYEVFQRNIVPLCIDFEKKVFSETEFKESYPKSNSFGNLAWTTKNYEKAIEIFNEITKKSINN